MKKILESSGGEQAVRNNGICLPFSLLSLLSCLFCLLPCLAFLSCTLSLVCPLPWPCLQPSHAHLWEVVPFAFSLAPPSISCSPSVVVGWWWCVGGGWWLMSPSLSYSFSSPLFTPCLASEVSVHDHGGPYVGLPGPDVPGSHIILCCSLVAACLHLLALSLVRPSQLYSSTTTHAGWHASSPPLHHQGHGVSEKQAQTSVIFSS